MAKLEYNDPFSEDLSEILTTEVKEIEGKIRFPRLYKRNNNGSVQQWQMYVKGNTYWAEYGQVDGKIQSDTPTVAEPKNVGRANETTPEEQAYSEAKSKHDKKIDQDGYWEDINKIDTFTFSTMLAHKLSKHGHKLEGKEVFASPKLDGIRCYITKDGAYSRNGKQFVSTRFIEEDLMEFFNEYPNAILDGELYNDDYKDDFNKIVSLSKKSKNISPLVWDEIAELLEYHIFDYPCLHGKKDMELGFYDRYELVQYHGLLMNMNRIKFVDQKFFSQFDRDDEEFINYRANLISDGYEGVMVKDARAPYEMKRSYTLQKSKDFFDDEFEIVDIIEGSGNRSGMMGRLVLTNGNSTFEANSRGNEEYYRLLLEQKDKYIGKMATVRYQNLTPDEQVPRFGVVIGIRDYE